MTRDDLIAFEADIADCFNRGEIRAPVHLAGGNEDDLIELFKLMRPDDWICGAWRMHYHCLLKGVPLAQLKADILAGRSITLCYPHYRIITSAIVGGILPIALGLAWSIKRAGGKERVWVFCGDMAAMSGAFAECSRYAQSHDLPMVTVIEDNGLSVCTPTDLVCGTIGSDRPAASVYYRYDLKWPHSGAGKRVEF